MSGRYSTPIHSLLCARQRQWFLSWPSGEVVLSSTSVQSLEKCQFVLSICSPSLPQDASSQVFLDYGSPTPWNGLYCASKAALQSISDILSMECKPFNISVLHVAPGAVRSNIAANARPRFRLADHTLYTFFLPNIIKRINASQSSNSMPTDEFANEVVSKVLRPYPPIYMSLGGHSRLFAFFKWLPKTWVLQILWRQYSKSSSWSCHSVSLGQNLGLGTLSKLTYFGSPWSAIHTVFTPLILDCHHWSNCYHEPSMSLCSISKVSAWRSWGVEFVEGASVGLRNLSHDYQCLLSK